MKAGHTNPLFLNKVPEKQVEVKPEQKRKRSTLSSLEKLTSLSSSELYLLAEILSQNPLAPIGDTEIRSWKAFGEKSNKKLSFSSLESTTPLKILGEGAFGRVWLASLDKSLEFNKSALFAVKQLSLEDLIFAKQSFRAGRELRALSTLRSINQLRKKKLKLLPATSTITSCPSSSFCVQLQGSYATDASSSSSFLYLILDAAPHGKTLYDIVKLYKVSPPNLCHVRFYLACLVLALEEVHSLGYIHRDIKLDNVIIQAESDGYPRLVDFGFVRSIRPILTACPKCGEQSDHSLFKTRYDDDDNDNDDEESIKRMEADYTSIITQLSQLECCDCSCVNGNEDFITNVCNEMHLYHNCAESIIHLAKLFKKSRTTSTTIHHIQQHNLTSFKEDKGAGAHAQVNTRPKRSSSLVGTRDYFPPELHTPLHCKIDKDDEDDDKRSDCSVDIWSLGVLAYELLTGISPFSQRVISKKQTDTEEEDNEEEDSVVANRAKNVTLLDLSTLILQLHSKHDTKVEAEDAVDLVRMLLQPIPSQRPCVHQIMHHSFFKSHIDWKELQFRHITPPPVSSKEDLFDIKRQFESREEREDVQEDDVQTHITQSLKFGEETFLGMSEQLYEARRAGGLVYAQGEYKDDPLELVDEFRL